MRRSIVSVFSRSILSSCAPKSRCDRVRTTRLVCSIYSLAQRDGQRCEARTCDRFLQRPCGGGWKCLSSTPSLSADEPGVTRRYRCSSIYRGVIRHRRKIGDIWKAYIVVNGQLRHLGLYSNEEEAARAYDRAAKQFHRRPILNFLEDGTLNEGRKKRRVLPEPKIGWSERPPTSSTFRGVTRNRDKWVASVSIGNRNKYLGAFEREEQAARAYDRAAKELYQDPIVNFLEDGTLNPARKSNSRSYLTQRVSTSRFRGVHRLRRGTGRWKAQIAVQGNTYLLGIFDEEVDAAKAYDRAAKAHHHRPVLNFPEEEEEAKTS